VKYRSKIHVYSVGFFMCALVCVLMIGAASRPSSSRNDGRIVQQFERVTTSPVREKNLIALPSTHYELPEVFTWSIPNGTTSLERVADGTIKPVIKVTSGVWCDTVPSQCCSLGCPCYQRSPWSVVSKIVNQYAAYGDIYGDSPTILLQELGMGNGDPCPQAGMVQHWMYADALFLHWCDQIKPPGQSDPCAPPSSYSGRWLSPWNDNGVQELKSWITTFLSNYQTRINAGTLPVPERFEFDTEYWPMVTYWGDTGVRAFRNLAGLHDGISDARWDTQILPVYNATLKELYDEAIANGMTPPVTGGWADEANHSWTRWYDGVLSTLCDAAMKEAFFDPIREVWPDVICSNFDTSISTDGLQSIPGSPVRVFRNRRHQSASWFTLVQEGSSDEQTAEMYCISELHLQENEDSGLAWSRVHRANIEACLESYEGFSVDVIMPWIPLVGTGFITGWNGEVEIPDKWSVRNLLGMFRSKGIEKFFVWSTNEHIQNWKDFDDIIGQVWQTELENYTVQVGLAELGATSKLLVSDWNWKEEYLDDVLRIEAVHVNDELKVECDFEFGTEYNCSQTREMQLMVDARLEGDLVELDSEATLDFSIQNTMTGQWFPLENVPIDLMWFDMSQDKWVWEEELDASAIEIDQRRVVIHVPIEFSRYWISETGTVNIRLAAHSPNQFSILIDAATLFETDDEDYSVGCLRDCAPEGGDGVVGLEDLLQVIADFETGSGRSDVFPECGDGKVGVHDILEIVLNWETTCE
jgi:hypothetical protein